MKNFELIINTANEVMKATAKSRRAYKESYYSLSRLLRDAQMKSMMPLTAPIFQALGLPVDGKVKPSDIMSSLHPDQTQVEKDGSLSVLLWSRVQNREKDANGVMQPIFEADGVTPVMVDKASRIKEGAWTIDKLCRLIAQRNALKA